MSDITTCPACRVKLKLPESAFGLDVQCPHCQHVFRAENQAIKEKPPDEEIYRGQPPVLYEKPLASRFDEYEEEHFRPGRPLAGLGRGVASIIMLAITLAVQGIGMVISWLLVNEINPLIRMGQDPFGANLQKAQALDSLHGMWGYVEIGVSLATVIVFLTWLSSAYANLESLGARHLRYSPGWAVGYYFIPIANLFRPIQVMQEIWRESDPQNLGTNSAMAGFWWACWIITGILGQVSFRMVLNANATLEEVRTALNVGIVSGFFYIAAGVLLIFLIKEIMRRQKEKYQRLLSPSAY